MIQPVDEKGPSAVGDQPSSSSLSRRRAAAASNGERVTGGYPLPTDGWVAVGSIRQTEEHNKGTVDAHEVGCRQSAEALTQVGPRHRRDLVDHHLTGLVEAGDGRRIDINSSQRSLDRITREGADGNRSSGVETVVLHNDNRTRLARIGAAGSGRVDIASSHADSDAFAFVFHSVEIASTNAWSSASRSLAAMAAD